MLQTVPGYEGELKIPYLLYAVPHHSANPLPMFYKIEFEFFMRMNGIHELTLETLHDVKTVAVRNGGYLPKYFAHGFWIKLIQIYRK